MSIKERIEQARLEYSWVKPYVKWDAKNPRVIEEVNCKCCGKLLVGERLDPNRTKTETAGETKIIYKYIIRGQTPDYDELEILFDNNTSHITPICRECKKTADDKLEAIYMADILQMEEESIRNGGVLDMKLMDRTPIGRN